MPMDINIRQLLTKLVSLSSAYPHEEKISEFVYNYFLTKNYRVTKQLVEKNRYNILVEKGSGKKSILLYAHLDTVGVANGWTTNPHILTVKGDRAYGLGAWDMKAGVISNIVSFLSSSPKNIKVKMAFCIDEENISKGGFKLINSPFMKDVVNVVSTEPAFAHGNQGVVAGRIGRAVYTVSIKGQSKHYAFYEPSCDINYVLSEFIQSLKKVYKKNGDKKQFVFARKIESTTTGMSLPEQIMCELDSAILPPLTHAKLLAKLKGVAKKMKKKYNKTISIDVNLKQRESPFLEPYVVSPYDKYFSLMKKSIYETTGKRAVSYFRSSVADENIFGSRKISTLGIGPVGGNAHSCNEWVSLQSISKVSEILTTYIRLVDLAP